MSTNARHLHLVRLAPEQPIVETAITTPAGYMTSAEVAERTGVPVTKLGEVLGDGYEGPTRDPARWLSLLRRRRGRGLGGESPRLTTFDGSYVRDRSL